jgi:cytochrome c551/c552
VGYNIYRNGELLQTFANAQSPGARIVYLDGSVEPDTFYVYQITAIDGDNESRPSDPISLRIAPSLRKNIQTSWGAGTDTLWQVSGCVGCHRGAPGGLTLRGPTADDVFAELTEDAGASVRRVDTADPPQSLVLCKALIATHPRGCAHGGGDFFVSSDPAYQTLLRWIEHGAPDN